ncbi:Riboflavin kinase [Moelleriella libera RCEF 2490]|uniref:Riboflavin kinase n=1 Tax=Moelleriella libera RCEF 2490 TaxID=1081109 RepID=A0A168CMP5_9HYPO|nr:Riboflavin kinase [Moelleriella libera RCEF 2490]
MATTSAASTATAPAAAAAAAAAIIGSTGLVGSNLLSVALASDAYNPVHTITRRAPKQQQAAATSTSLHAVVDADTTTWAATLSSGLSPPPTEYNVGPGGGGGGGGGKEGAGGANAPEDTSLATAPCMFPRWGGRTSAALRRSVLYAPTQSNSTQSTFSRPAQPSPAQPAMSSSRPLVVGPDDGPSSPPYPYLMEGKVISGFGRGSKELGIPTANLPVDASLTPWIASVPSGVYFGYASLQLPAGHAQKTDAASSSSFDVFPMVMSIGYNPFYKNTVRSAEVHVLHHFDADFYGAHMRLLILGFIREEKDYQSLEALIEDIQFDSAVARKSLERDAWQPGAVTVPNQNQDQDQDQTGSHGAHAAPAGSVTGAEWLARPL